MPEDVWGPSIERLITEEDAADILFIRPKTLSHWRVEGKGPTYKKIGGAVRYSISDLEKFIREATYKSTTQEQSDA